jgi:hypothetical protein
VTEPERLLAEALRAQAAGTGPSAIPFAGTPAEPPPRPARPPGAFRVPAWSVLLLALLLGLAAGATIGLLTMV